MEDSPEKISVIMPVYNAGKLIEKALRSLEGQTSKDFKVIIINDGSIDNSEEVINNICQTNNLNVVYKKQENKGVSSARNYALDLVDTDYVMFLDADDEYHPKMIETVLESLKKTGADIVGNGHTQNYDLFAGGKTPLAVIDDLNTLKEEILYKNAKYNFWDFCLNTRILKANNIRFHKDLKYGEDELFLWEYLTYCKTVYKTNLLLYYYRDNATSATKKITRLRTQVIESQIRVANYLKEHNDDFARTIVKYGIPRAKIAILREFAKAGLKDDFDWLTKCEEYKCDMKSLLTFPDVKIKIAALFYNISPSLFYYLIK